jgi:putative sterol carrier protein
MCSTKQTEEEEKDMSFKQAKEVFEKMPHVFNAAAAAGVDAVFQYHITGPDGGEWHITVKDNSCQITEGVHENPTVSLTMSVEDWLAMCNKQLDPMTAFMSSKLKASGNIMMAQRIPNIFPL